MDISKLKQKNIQKLLKSKNSTTEIEARFGDFVNKKFVPGIKAFQYHRLMRFFTSKKDFYKHSVSYQIIQFSSENNTKKITNVDKTFEAINDVKYVQKTKKQTIDVSEYSFRVSSSEETETTDSAMTFEEGKRYRTRHTFQNNAVGIKIEISEVYINETKVMDIELESIGCSYDVFMTNINLITCILQDSEIPISSNETNKVLKTTPKKFLGVQPKAIRNELMKDNMAITKKLDGERYLMTINDNKMFLLGKNGNVKKFPFTIENADSIIFDGELFRGNFYIFDVISSDNLKERLDIAKNFVSQLKRIGDGYSSVYIKEYIFTEDVSDTLKTMRSMVEKLEDIYDGLIVVNTEGGYYDSNPLKWKKVITFDFELIKTTENNYTLNMGKPNNKIAPFSEIEIKHSIPDHTIVECFYKDSKWNILRIRHDKIKPNFETVIIDNWNCVVNPFIMKEMKETRKKIQKGKKPAFYNMRRFHNYIKRRIISSYPSNSVLDLACGKGGDFPKYIDTNIRYIEGYDNDIVSIEQAIKRKEHFLSKAMCKNFDINIQEKDLIISAVSSDIKFDLVVCNFAYHYFHEEPDNITKSITANTRKGSVLVLTLLDCEKVIPCDHPDLKIEIINQEKISVFIKDSVLNEPREEFLVPKNELIDHFKKNGFSLVKENNFSDFYKDWNHHDNHLDDLEIKYSFMNNVYIFKKS